MVWSVMFVHITVIKCVCVESAIQIRLSPVCARSAQTIFTVLKMADCKFSAWHVTVGHLQANVWQLPLCVCGWVKVCVCAMTSESFAQLFSAV